MIDPTEEIMARAERARVAAGRSLYALDQRAGGRWPRRLLLREVEPTVRRIHDLARLLDVHPAPILDPRWKRLDLGPTDRDFYAIWRPAQARLRAGRLQAELTAVEWAERAGLHDMHASTARRQEYEVADAPLSRWWRMCFAALVDPVETLYPEVRS